MMSRKTCRWAPDPRPTRSDAACRYPRKAELLGDRRHDDVAEDAHDQPARQPRGTVRTVKAAGQPTFGREIRWEQGHPEHEGQKDRSPLRRESRSSARLGSAAGPLQIARATAATRTG